MAHTAVYNILYPVYYGIPHLHLELAAPRNWVLLRQCANVYSLMQVLKSLQRIGNLPGNLQSRRKRIFPPGASIIPRHCSLPRPGEKPPSNKCSLLTLSFSLVTYVRTYVQDRRQPSLFASRKSNKDKPKIKYQPILYGQL